MNKMSHALAEPVERHDYQVKICGVCIPLVSRSAVLPSSYSQQRLWFQDQLVPGGSNYNVPGAVKFEGPLDVEVLERALREIVRRHEALRTRFVAVEGEAQQMILDEVELKLEVMEVGGEGKEREEKTERLAREEAQRPFDLGEAPLLRTRLLRRGAEDHVLLVTMHHIISDAWSLGVLMREASVLYRAFSTGKESPLPELEIQYVDYCAWQREWLSADVLERQAEYWKKRLSGAAPALEMPTDHPRPAMQSSRGARKKVSLGEELVEELRCMGTEEGATLYMVLLAGFQALLYRYSGQADIAVGSSITRRTRAEMEGLIGLFVNTLVMRTEVEGGWRFKEMLERVKEGTLEAYGYQDVPFEMLVEVLVPQRDMSRTPLFQVMFILQNAPLPELELGGARLKPFTVDYGTSKFDLTMSLEEVEGGIGGYVEYNTDLYEEGTVERLLGHYEMLLRGAVRRREERIEELLLLREEEREELERWNETEAQVEEKCIHELFEEQVERRPEAWAVVQGEKGLSYRELNEQANQLAWHLKSNGVGVESRVGVYLERSFEYVIALLGILKSGAAYVPLDPNYPDERLRFIVEIAKISTIVCMGPRPRLSIPDVNWIDIEGQDLLAERKDNLKAMASPENAAYIIFTSGSTGIPNGVIGLHRGAVNRFSWMWRQYPFTGNEKSALKTSINFGDSIWEIFGPLLRGVPSVILDDDTVRSPRALIAALDAERITRMVVVPSLLRLLLEADPAITDHLPALRYWTSSGEALPPDLLNRFRQLLPQHRILNLYGCSEVSADSLAIEVTHGDFVTNVPIGRPISNTQVYLLDEAMQPVPIGVTGEIYLSGNGLARGCLFQPDLTAERFLPHPYSSEPGARIYRTRDLARYRPNGVIEYVGRADRQVKLRGMRIDLREVEAVLRQNPLVKETVVLLKSIPPVGESVVAYVTSQELLTSRKLRSFLKQRLPGYMVPSVYVTLEAMPLNANGKIDRHALPKPKLERSEGYIRPRTPVEELVSQTWSEVLGVEQVGAEDDFFALGGHSLLAAQVMARLRATLGVELPLRALFETPTVEALAGQVQLARGRQRGVELPLRRRARQGEMPLSYAQERLWFVAQFEGGSEAYHVPLGLRLEGNLNQVALKRALDRIVWRHEALRTSFQRVEERTVQKIAPSDSGFVLTEEDLRGSSSAEAAVELERQLAEEAQVPFDLEQGPLIRGRLIRVGEQEHVLAITMHHIVSDGWSLGVLREELSALYQAYGAGEEDPLPPLPIQYADYAVWQREWLKGERLQRQRVYWQQVLEGAPRLLELPTDRPRPEQQSFVGNGVRVELDGELVQRLKAQGRKHGATLYMTVLAAWAVVLSRLSGQKEVVIGSPVANRVREEIEKLIGFFVNTQALRVEVSGSVAELLEQVQGSALGAQEHQDMPFEQVVELLQAPRSLSQTPIFQVMLAWQNNEEGVLELPGVAVSAVNMAYTPVKFDLELDLGESGDGVSGDLRYATALFDRSTIERHAGYLRRVLEAMVADEQRAVDSIDLLSEAERHRLLIEWNDTRREYPHDKCIHELFEAQVERTPDAIALVHEGRKLTYGELNRRANQLAHYLRAWGVGPDARVAICAERGLEMMAALLAILKAGGAYVPLDPAYPVERLRYMLEDSAPVGLLTQAHLQGLFSGVPAVLPVLDLSAAAPTWHDQPETNPEHARLVPQHLAYIIYTSGSTGTPKGVMVQHRSVVRLVRNTDYVQLSPHDVVAQASTASFDAATFEIWGALLNGACTVCIGKDALLSPSILAEQILRNRITVLFLSTALFNQIACDAVKTFSNLRYLLFGGEKVEPRWVARVRTETEVEHLLHVYGPTETTTYAAWYEVRNVEAGRTIPIGRPIANTQIYIVDTNGEPVPVGVAGELYIGGPGVARGYLNRAELTAERFVVDPFSCEVGACMYRTGDLGRWLADGSIEFLGRNDFQVKIRGFRIELGEIETRLSECPGVLEEAVVACEDVSGDRRLVAYVRTEVGARLEIEGLRAHLGAVLPEYMVPTAYVTLEKFPLNANGKLDRKALPEPDADAYVKRAYEEPVGEVESRIAEIWAQVLKQERVGRRDNFFELGGHSLMAVTLISRLRAALGIKLVVKDVFAHPVLEEMAQMVVRAVRSEQEMLRPVSRATEMPLSYAQERLWFVAQFEGGSEAYHVPLGLRLEGNLNQVALKRALDRIVWRHEALRTSFQRVEERTVQKIAPSDSGFVLTEEDLRGSSSAEAAVELERQLAEEAQVPFDLEQGPLIRGRLIRVGEQEHVLAITMHHIVSDGWSLGVLREELSALYQAYGAGEEDPLPPLPIQYADYAVWQREWLKGERLQRQRVYWQQVLEGAPRLLELPTDRPRPEQQSFVGNGVRVELDGELVQRLKAQGRKHGATLYMTVLAAWAVVLSRLSGQKEVVIGSPVANRVREEIEKLIGFFVNTQALRVEVSGSVAELLEQVQGSALGAQEHQDMPFEQVVELLQAPRSLSQTPIFQVMLAWQNNEEGVLELPGVAVSAVNMAYTPVKFDLELDLGESGDGVSGDLRYATALFDRSTIERHAGYLRRVLEAMVADEQRAVDSIDLLSEAERHRLLIEWNDTRREYPHDKCIHELFEAQVERTPDAIALVHEGRKLTYGELNRRANQLAHYLRAWGVGPDARVAICAERGLEMMAALLAILKAGGAYVPLDPAYPVERLRYMLEDSAPVGLLTQAHLQGLFSGVPAVLPVLDLSAAAPTWHDQPETNPEHARLVPQHLAYIIYTSGSTGTPKGVMVQHRSVVRLVRNTDYVQLSPHDVVAQASTASFDAATFEIWGALLNGACTVCIGKDALLSPSILAEQILRNRITVLFLSTALFNQIACDAVKTFSNLRYLLFGGEKVEPRWVARVRTETEVEHLLHVYGPTETTTYAAWYEVRNVEAGRTIPIGRPIANTQIYIVDTNGEPVPVGVAGELYIGGPGVARGYLNRAELTAERFVVDPFSCEVGACMYRTGDLGRWLADGSIEFLGRNDFQVKIRGFRIELGEIETRLSECPGVLEEAVVACEDVSGDRRLVAYVRTEVGARLEIEGLRAHLGAVLPEYMVPTAYVTLEKFPLNANGKLDRKALPEPDADAYVKRAYEEPVGEVESRIAEIWAQVLKQERVGRRDNFFELGGHSLMAVTLISRLRAALGIKLVVKDVFAHPVLEEMAQMVVRAVRSEQEMLRPVSRATEMPLSYAQERLWFVAQFEGGSEAYHVPLGLRLEGNLNQVALKRALDRIVWRHEALRTSFQRVEERTVQKIAPSDSGFVLTEEDLRGSSSAEAAVELERQLAEEAQVPFDLEQGPLIRGRLIRVGEQEHVLAITMHHIVSDGWSLGVLREELSALYQAYGAGEEDPLPPLPIQYADYAVWQREWLKGERLQRQRVYWQQVLEGAPRLLELPTDRPRPEQQSFVGNGVRVELDGELVQRLKAQGRKHGATLYMTVLAAWAVVLSRLSGQKEVVIGSPVANRVREEIEKLIGFFVNTQALRVEVSGSVAELLEQVQGSALGAQEHQDMPFEQVVELLQAPRSLSQTPIFQVMLAWQNNEEGVLELPGVAVSAVNMAYTPVKFDLELDLGESGDGVSGDLRYATALFDRSTIERHAGYLRRVLEAMVADEQRAVDSIDLLSEAERHRLLIEWNDTRREYPHDKCIHELFEAQVERTPNAIAVVFEELRISYAELNERANRLAHYLVAREVEPETFVAISMERSVDMVVAILATLKAGGAYVPLDSYFPQDRQDFIVADCNAKVVIADQDRSKNFPGMELSCVDVQRAASAIERCSSSNLGIRMDAENAAYVLYTSGSTGIPKGAIVTHRAVNRLVINNNYASIEATDCVAHCSSPAFDASTFEVWGALLNGARMLLVSRSVVLDPKLFSLALKQNGVTTLWLTSALLNQYADSLGSIFTQLKYLLAGGERLDPRVIRRVLHDNPPQNLLNGYGPTECTTFSCTYRIQSVAEDASNVPIGCPIANAQTYILDRHLQPIPIGVTGEIYIGGAGLARGYLQRPDRTAELFIPSPFAPGERLYKTGDLGRWRADGLIECLGRNDFQVKIRGFRIELGEIEARLSECPGVLEAAVVAREDVSGDRRLVAYLRTEAGARLEIEGLRAHLGAVLPEYMVPAVYVTLEKFPLTANGKLDRKGLSAPEADAYLTREYEAPVSELEKTVARIWGEVLKRERVGRRDNFFELGGHSLLAVTLSSHVRDALGADVAVRDIFRHPVMAAFAGFVEEAERGKQSRIAPAPRIEALPLSHAQQRLWFLTQLEGGSEAYHVPIAQRLTGELNRDALKRALDRMVWRHEVLRTSFERIEDEVTQRISPPDSGFALEEVDLQSQENMTGELEQRLVAEAGRSFDLERGPVARGHLIRLSEHEHVLLLTIHHIAFDGWSIGILMRELSALYRAYCRGEEDPLPPLAIQYADYAVWQREWLTGEVFNRQSEYWRQTLEGAPALLELPTDRPRPAQQSFDGNLVRVELEKQLAWGLKALCRRYGTTLYMTSLAAWAVVLSCLSRKQEVVIGTPVAGRTRKEIESLIGFFVNTLAMRVKAVGSVRELLLQVKENTLDTQEHQDLPFEKVVELVKAPRSPSATPLFQTMLAWQKAEKEELDLPGVKVSQITIADRVAKFDLDLDLMESDNSIQVSLQYATALFDLSTMKRHMGYLLRVLEAMAADDDKEIEEIELLSQDERHQLLYDWNDTGTAFPADKCVHQLFEEQVARTPDAIALVDEGGLLTYDQLNRRANQLARHLRMIGVLPDARVAICLERGPDVMVSMLATLKAGAGYVPLDPAYPADRLAYMIDDSAASVILTRAAGSIGYTGAIPVLDVQADAAAWSGEAETDLGLDDVLPQHTAYVIYTSGSTGQPKGVVVEHANVVNLVHEYIKLCSLTASDRILQFASYSFDASVEEIFPALCVGATIVLRPAHLTIPDVSFVNFLVAHQVTIADLPTAFWHLWAAEVKEGRSKPDVPLRMVVVGGEKAERRHLINWLERCGNHSIRWINTYGPTEATVNATSLCVDPPAVAELGEIPIGRPVANARIYILDSHGQVTPVGVAGEIHVGGAGVVRGYLGKPGLTSERFIPDLFSSKPGGRLYKTGDVGRWLPDGNAEYLGRNDFQVKIRGYRIELGEIEARLSECPGVLEAAVVAREDASGDRRLVAYLRTEVGARLEIERLRAHLGAVLPEYMVPAVYVTLEKFPLTANGKLDRKGLPEPDADAYVKRAYGEPVGEVESRIAQIWAQVLKLDRVGRYDNFFELGGHSLLAITVIGRARRAGLQIEVRSLFAAPTLKALAEVVGKEAVALEVSPNLIPAGCICITPGMLPLVKLSENEIAAIVSSVQGGAANVQDIYPLAPLQAGMLFHHRLQTEGDVSLIERVFGFDTRERFDRYAAALQAVIDRHDILRTAFVWEDLPEPVQVVWRHAALAIEEVELDAARGDVAAQLRTYCDPRHRRLDLRQAPLWRLFIAKDAANKRWVAVELIHHLIQDETTFRLLGADLEAFLLAQAQDLPAPIPFRNFVAQARLAVSQSEHEAFFSEILDGVDEPTMAFGLGDIRGDGSRIAAAEQHLDHVLSGRLRAAARAKGVSVATLCHLAWAMVLARTSGRDDVTFGTIIFGRMQDSDGADRALGMFINLLPLRLQVGHESVYASLRKTHRLLSQLLRHEHAPLSLAQRCSGIRSPRPLFTTTLNYHYGVAEARSAEALRQSAQAWEGIELFDTQQRTNYPFNMYIEDTVDDITLIALVDKSLDPVQVCGMMRTALESLADGLEHAPEEPLCSLDILSATERRKVAIDFNATATTHSQDVCLHILFEEQVARTPDAVALVDESGLLTYDQLNRRANQLARHLRTIGILPDARVAICLERGPDVMVSMLATLKVGAGYVPLDPAYPADRLAYMIDDSAASVILTRAAGSIGYTGAIPVLDVQADAAAWSGEADTNPGFQDVSLQHTAYVIYTSGSTGQPKGVVVEHANVVNLVSAHIELCSLTASDRVLQFASYSFDNSVEEIFPALCVGATIVLRPAHLTIPDASFVDFLAAHQVTVADLPTAFWHLWAAEIYEGRSKPGIPLRMVIAGGEKAERRHLIHWLDGCGSFIRWINTYGPTEATVNASSICMDPVALAGMDEIPIGRPIANAKMYILNGHGQITPIGVAGEIYIGGAGVARGYLGKPGLTAERFVPDPFSSKPGGRLYKTGDVGRWLPDGNIEYLGRNDFQIKIRGYRIEMGEIESKVRDYPGVHSAVVIVREDTPGEKRLVAYVQLEPGTELSAATLRTHLAASLPAYMLPGAFVQLDALPLTPSGKLDRESLPMPEDDAFAARVYEEPLSEVEIAIAQIWADVLDLDRVGRHDNFFELGGHSLLVTAVIERMRRANLKAEVRALFLAPTLALLAGLTEEVTEVVL